MSRISVVFTAAWIGLAGSVSAGNVRPGASVDSRDALLAALGTATLDCLSAVGPSNYRTTTGILERTFQDCGSGDPAPLQRIDALLGLQTSYQGRLDDIAGHYVARWNAFQESFDAGNIAECPLWQLQSVIDPPTRVTAPRFAAARRIGKENYRYIVSSASCPQDGGCATRQAVKCAAGFGPLFVVGYEPHRSQIEIDPVWWLTTYEFEPEANPFLMPGYYHAMSYYGALPGSLYGSLQRADEACSQWSESAQKHYVNRVLVPIDCGGGWFCMTYCTTPNAF